MSLRTLLLYAESLGDEDYSVKTTSHSESVTESSEKDRQPVSKVTDEEGEINYCFRNTQPVSFQRDVRKYPFDLNAQSTESDGVTIPVLTANVQKNTWTSNLTIKHELLQYFEQRGMSLVLNIKPKEDKKQITSSYKADGYTFTSQPVTGQQSVIIVRTNANSAKLFSTSGYDYFFGEELFLYFFQNNKMNHMFYYTGDVTITAYGMHYKGETRILAYKGATFINFNANTSLRAVVNYRPMSADGRGREESEDSLTRTIYNVAERKSNDNTRINREVITQSQEGFWKIITENFSIQLRVIVEGYGVMGGTFGNWLVDSGFKTVEENYQYVRNGTTVYATTVTTPKPTRRCGVNRPYFGQLQYSGQMMCLSGGDLVEVYYTERDWTLSNAIYAKNFATDLNRTFQVTNQSNKFLCQTNVIPHKIPNCPGIATISYHSGGFGQIDTSTYTGLALIFRFQCTNNVYEPGASVPQEECSTFATAGATLICDHPINGMSRTDELSVSGYGSCYPPVSTTLDLSVTYTSLLPSDPSFTTGGQDFNTTVTLQLQDSFLSLQQQINDLTTRLNISDLTGGITSFISSIGSFPQIVEGVMSAFKSAVKSFKKIKGKVNGVASRIRNRRYTRLFDEDVIIPETPTLASSVRSNRRPSIAESMLNEDQMFTVIHNAAVSIIGSEDQLEHASNFAASLSKALMTETSKPLNPIVATRAAFAIPPAICSADDITSSTLRAIEKITGNVVPKKSLIEIDQIRNTITIFDPSKNLSRHLVNMDVIDAVLTKMSGTHARSLFSLNLRKQLVEFMTPSGIAKLDYETLIKRMLNDRELLDITNNLDSDKMISIFEEFVQLVKHSMN